MFSKHFFTFILTIFFVMNSIGALAEENKPSDIETEPEDCILVADEVWVFFVEQPGFHLHRARDNFLRKEIKAAVKEIRTVAAFIKLQAARATTKGKKGLLTSINELENLAKQLEDGVHVSAETLNNVFAHAHHSLAEHHYLKASESWKNKENKKVGYYLKAAATHAESAAAWVGHEIKATGVEVMANARTLSQKLIKGVDNIADDVHRNFQRFDNFIENLGKKIKSTKEDKYKD